MTTGPAPERAADRVRIVFFGSGSFAMPALEALAGDSRVELVGVVTAPDRPAGRGRTMLPTPVALRARTMWLPLLQRIRVGEPGVIVEIATLRPDLGVLADYGQIIPRELLDLPRLGILNLHPSLLPRHRGATPIPAAIAAGDPRLGVTIIRMDEGLDTGPIVTATAWPATGRETAPQLEAFAAREAATLLGRTLDRWVAGEIRPKPQPEAGATITRRLRRDDARLDPTRPVAQLERHVRAYLPWPGSALETPAGRLVVHKASVAPTEPNDEPGTFVAHGDGLALATGDGRLVLDGVQLAGRRPMRGADFLRGQRDLLGARAGKGSAGGGAAAAGAAGAAESEPGADADEAGQTSKRAVRTTDAARAR
jgi:methionyl-tRNA formyltransferase